MEDTSVRYYDHVSERIRRILAIVVSILLCLSAAVLVVVGMQSITALAAVFTLFSLSIVFVLGVMGIGRACCCKACDGPIKRSFWFLGPSSVSLVANSMRSSTRDSSITEIPYPHSTDLPSWINEQNLQPPPDYFSVTRCTPVRDQSAGGQTGQETPPPSYKFLHEAGLIHEGDRPPNPPPVDDIHPPSIVPSEHTIVTVDSEELTRSSQAIIKDEDKPSKGDNLC